MKVAITGALGHIGSRLIRSLPQAVPGVTCVLVDNLATKRYCSLFHLPSEGRFSFHEADILTADLARLFAGCDAVVHLAANTEPSESVKRTEEIERINYDGTTYVANSCANLGVPLLFVSSTSVYGSRGTVVSESSGPDDLQPFTPYAVSKLKAEKLLEECSKGSSFRFTTLRFGTIVGASPGMRYHTAVSRFVWQAVTQQPLTVWKTALHQRRPYLALEDAVAAIIFTLTKGLFSNDVFNVVTENTTVSRILDFLREYLPRLVVQEVSSEVMNEFSFDVSNSKLQELGFEYRGSLRKGIEETLDLLSGLAASSTGASR